MEITHNLGSLRIEKHAESNVGFLLTNNKGGYCSFFNKPISRYHGLFYFDEAKMSMYRFIENIEVVGSNNVVRLKNNFYFFERKRDSVVEFFLMPKHFNALVYELNAENEIDLFLDCKNSYDNSDFGRYYDISEEQGCIVIKFIKKIDGNESINNKSEEFTLNLAIKSDKNIYAKNDRWVERHYSYDEERGSPPFKRYVYDALRLKGTKLIFSISTNKNDAIKECEYLFNNLEAVKTKEKEDFVKILNKESLKRILKNKKINNIIKIGYVNAHNSLNNLIVDNKSNYGLMAGLPWFFQFWSRDALISLKSLLEIDRGFAEKVLFDYLNGINDDGRILNLIGKNTPTDLESADSHGWLFFRCNEIFKMLNKNKELINSIKISIKSIKQNKSADSPKIKESNKKFNLTIKKKESEYRKIIYEIESSLEKSLYGLLKCHTKNGFELNAPKETWMDTDFENDNRNGSRIEMQALRLHMYKLMFELSQNRKYKVLENVLKNKVREKFWNENNLYDGLGDATIRPNVFIAAYVYPELLTKEEWEVCSENALKNLWLNWGGLSSIDKNNPLFTEKSTGEDIRSYHRGDSWFWINNLAALTLNRINNKKFNNEIKKIINASSEEILWKGCIGCHSELSSAKELSSKGCFNQAWSNAMYIEMIDEVFF